MLLKLSNEISECYSRAVEAGPAQRALPIQA
jgi:hypothetical protein